MTPILRGEPMLSNNGSSAAGWAPDRRCQWRSTWEKTVKTARLAVQTNVFPLYEVDGGIHYTLNFKGDRKVNEYFTSQGRFKHLSDTDIDVIQHQVDAEWDLLVSKASANR